MRYLASEEIAVETVRQAVKMGVNHIETARGYGNSEQYLGKAFGNAARSQLYITTKIPPTADGDLLERSIDESLARLKTDYIDCLAIHGINTQEHLDAAVASMPAVAKLKSDRRVRHLGFSTHAPLEIILAAINTDLFEFVNLHYYYFFQRNAPAIELAAKKDMGVFIISPADKGGQLYTPPETLQQLCQPLSPLELNYRFLLSDRRITTVSVGAANPQELELPLSKANNGDRLEPLTNTEIEAFQRLESRLGERLGTDKCSQCYACLPCPEGINIPEVLRLRNLAIAYDMTEFGKYRYRMFENAGHWFWGNKGSRCTSCGDCLPRCPEELDIPALLKDTHQRLKSSEGRRLWE